MPRITKSNCQKLLNQNEGFSTLTNFASRKSKEERFYKISGGQLHIFADGKDLQTREPYVKAWIASEDEILRFCRSHRFEMNLAGIE